MDAISPIINRFELFRRLLAFSTFRRVNILCLFSLLGFSLHLGAFGLGDVARLVAAVQLGVCFLLPFLQRFVNFLLAVHGYIPNRNWLAILGGIEGDVKGYMMSGGQVIWIYEPLLSDWLIDDMATAGRHRRISDGLMSGYTISLVMHFYFHLPVAKTVLPLVRP